MNWHKLPEIPTKDKTLCLVDVVERVDVGEESLEESYYEVMWYHSNNHYFSKQSDPKGIMGIKQENIIRWTEIN